MVTVRDYSDADEARVIALVQELQGHEFGLYERMKPPEEIGAWYIRAMEKLCEENDGRILVAETENGKIVGYASILTDCSSEDDYDEVTFSYGYVADLVVADGFRGQGVGKLLLEACEGAVRVAGRDELRVSVLAANGDAHRLYERFGFRDHLITLRKRLA
jgi:ribosomal protein S18 acetylase RimI-like enzyme